MSDPDLVPGTRLPEDHPRVFGHDAPRAAVLDALVAGRLPGAILLHGPQGIGKASLVFDLAAAILTATGDEPEHRVREQIAAGSHPNLDVLRRRPRDSKNFYTVIRVDDIRGMVDGLRMTRGRAGHRIAVIDPIDDCNPSAANALLKMLEEPPPDATIFLVSHNPGRLLPTILSRCHRLALRPLPDDDVAAALTAQRADVEPDALRLAVARAGGRPRRGFEALDADADGLLATLEAWLAAPLAAPVTVQLDLAAGLAAAARTPALGFARELIERFMLEEARAAAAIPGARRRLASACELWEKAGGQFAQTEAINLDMRQTLASVFDAIRLHVQLHHQQQPAPA